LRTRTHMMRPNAASSTHSRQQGREHMGVRARGHFHKRRRVPALLIEAALHTRHYDVHCTRAITTCTVHAPLRRALYTRHYDVLCTRAITTCTAHAPLRRALYTRHHDCTVHAPLRRALHTRHYDVHCTRAITTCTVHAPLRRAEGRGVAE